MNNSNGDCEDLSAALPPVGPLTKISTAMCATVFDDLEMVLLMLKAGGSDLNPVQRELADRFTSTCKTFARDMLAAEGNSNALRMIFGLPPGQQSRVLDDHRK